MCLITKKKNVSIAKRDKTVFKWIRKSIDDPTLWCGPIYDYKYFPFNEVITAKKEDYYCNEIEIDHLQINHGVIHEGFHSFRIYSLRYLVSYHKICVIPKGSEYCYGMGGEVVSTKIIVFSSYKEYFKYKWKKLREKIS